MQLRWITAQLAAPLLLTVFTLVSPMAYALGGTDSGGGAGCKDEQGHLKTLYYCGAYKGPSPAPVTPAPQPLSIDGPSEQPKEIGALIDFIGKLHYLEASTRKELIRAIKPSFKRKYFSTLSPPALTAPIVERIKEEFHRATGLDPRDLSLYAVTDTNGHISNYSETAQITYLLPGFSALQTREQRMVALFHESLWAYQPDSDYQTIVAREMAFEAVMEQPNNTLRILDFVHKMEGNKVTTGYVSLAMKYDLETGALDGFANKHGEFSNVKFMGSKNIRCLNRAVQSSYKDYNIFDGKTVNQDLKDLADQCLTDLENQIDGLRRTYPKSLFLTIAGSPEAKALLEEARLTEGSSMEYDVRGMTAAFNRYLCYVAGRGGDDSGCTFQNLNDYYWSHGTVMLFFALERPLARAKICPIDGLDLFKEEQVIMRVETNPDQAKSGALVPASTPGSYIPGAYKCSDEPKPKPFSFF